MEARRAARDGHAEWDHVVRSAVALAEGHGCPTCAGMAHAVAGKLYYKYGQDIRAAAAAHGRAMEFYAVAGTAPSAAFAAGVLLNLNRQSGVPVTADVVAAVALARERLDGCSHADADRRAVAELAALHAHFLVELGRPDDARAALADALSDARLLDPQAHRLALRDAAALDHAAARRRVDECRVLLARRAADGADGVARFDDETAGMINEALEFYESAFGHAERAGAAELAAVIAFELVAHTLAVSDTYSLSAERVTTLRELGEHLPARLHADRDRVLAQVSHRSGN